MRRTFWTVVVGLAGGMLAAPPAWAVTGSLEITASTSSGQPLPGATITLFAETPASEDDDDDELTAIIGSSGTAQLTLETGRYRYSVRSDEHEELTGFVTIREGENRLDLSLTPSRPERPWGFNVAADVGSQGESPVSGQGITKPSGGGQESRTVASPDSFSVKGLDLELRLGHWFAGYERTAGDAEESMSTAPADNGHLYLGLTDEGFNGRLFSGFASEETIVKDYAIDRFRVGARLPFAAGGRSFAAVFGYFETGKLDYRNNWNVSDFPQARSDTDHAISWDAFGVGVRGWVPVAQPSDTFSVALVPEISLGRGSFDYAASQASLNPPGPRRDFLTTESTDELLWRLFAELDFEITITGSSAIFVSGGLGLRTLPTLEQPNGEQLVTGQRDALDFQNPREFRFTVGFRF